VDNNLGAGWEEWIFRGEKGVWEVGGYIRAKCAVEITLDHCIILWHLMLILVYSLLQNRKKDDGTRSPPAGGKETDIENDEGVRRHEDRGRAKSFGSEDPVRWMGGGFVPVRSAGDTWELVQIYITRHGRTYQKCKVRT
jgi:hypothetical protein